MQQLLEFQGDVEATFGLTFQVDYDYFGQLRTHELKRGGTQVSPISSARGQGLSCGWQAAAQSAAGRQRRHSARGAACAALSLHCLLSSSWSDSQYHGSWHGWRRLPRPPPQLA